MNDTNQNQAIIEFYKGNEIVSDKLQGIKKQLTNAMSAKNLAFLLGAGCSSIKDEDGNEKGIHTMDVLAKDYSELEDTSSFQHIKDEYKTINFLSLAENLEGLLQVLHALRLCFNQDEAKINVDRAINEVEQYLFSKINIDLNDSTEITNIYQSFYKRIFFRERSLPRPWVFTTNYDLLNEYALDSLGIPYCNGFSGGITRRFNPSTFKLTLAREIDISSNRWAAVDNFVYLCKLHGSISWVRDDTQGLWPFKEIIPPKESDDAQVMIYPTPAKEGQSLGSPYSDLFREFQGRIVREQSVLMVMGYSFSDEHINNIIFQALTIPSFRLVIFADPESEGIIATLKKLNDPRIWIIGGGNKEHFFKNVVEKYLPEYPEEKIENAIKSLQEALRKDTS